MFILLCLSLFFLKQHKKQNKDGWPGAPQAGWAGLFGSGGAVHRLGAHQRPLGVLLLWKPQRPGSLRSEALHTGEPLSSAAGQHRLRSQHPGRLLWEQLQAGHRDQVMLSSEIICASCCFVTLDVLLLLLLLLWHRGLWDCFKDAGLDTNIDNLKCHYAIEWNNPLLIPLWGNLAVTSVTSKCNIRLKHYFTIFTYEISPFCMMEAVWSVCTALIILLEMANRIWKLQEMFWHKSSQGNLFIYFLFLTKKQYNELIKYR